jgi:hypothetical protein
MTPWTQQLGTVSTFLLATSLTLPALPADALAQDSETEPQVVQEDGARYARLRFADPGIRIVGQAGERTGEQAGANSPVLPGEQILTGAGRAEIQLSDGSVVRLDRATSLETTVLADLDNRLETRTLLNLAAGDTYVYVSRMDSPDQQFRLDTPVASAYLLSEGVFRVDAAPDGSHAVVSSHSGVAEVVSAGISVLVRSGERTDVWNGRPPSDPRPFSAFAQDDFDRWNRARQGAYIRPYDELPVGQVPAEVEPYVTELAYYGRWVRDDFYGWVWVPPSAAAEWTPYTVGYWDTAPSGWLWVSAEPWGWAPYHYGRWDFAPAYGWVWIPGAVFAGAWVSWGWHPGYIGWCPLDYYNHPVVVHTPYAVHGTPHRAWVFVPQDQIAHTQLQRAALPKVRLESVAAQSVQLDRPPAVTPAAASRATRPAVPVRGPAVATAPADDGQLVSFRTLEGRGRARTEPIRAATASRTWSVTAAEPGNQARPVDLRTSPPVAPRGGVPASSGSLHRPGDVPPRPAPPATAPSRPAPARRGPAAAGAGAASTTAAPRTGSSAAPSGPARSGAAPGTAATGPAPAAGGTAGGARIIRTEDRSIILERIFRRNVEAPAKDDAPHRGAATPPAAGPGGAGKAGASSPGHAQPSARPSPPPRPAPKATPSGAHSGSRSGGRSGGHSASNKGGGGHSQG